MRTETLNTYKVTFSVTLEIEAASAQDAEELGFSDFVENLPRPKDFGAYVELIDGMEPGEDDDE